MLEHLHQGQSLAERLGLVGADPPGLGEAGQRRAGGPAFETLIEDPGLGEELDLHQSPGGVFQRPRFLAVAGMGVQQLAPHLARLLEHPVVALACRQGGAGRLLHLGAEVRDAGDDAGAGQGQVLPDPGALGLVAPEGRVGDRDRPLPPRRAQPHVHLVEPALGGGRRQGGDQRLGEARVIGRGGERLPAVRALDSLGVVDGDEVEVGARGHLVAAELAHADHHHAAAGRRAVAPGELLDDLRVEHGQRRLGDGGEGAARLGGVAHAPQHLHAGAEGLLVHPPAHGVEDALVIQVLPGAALAFAVHPRIEVAAELGRLGQWLEEIAVEERVQRLRMVREIDRQAGRRGADLDDQVEEMRIRGEEREHLHAGGKPGEKAVELDDRLVRAAGVGEPLDDQRLELAQEAPRPLAAGRRHVGAAPGLDQAHGIRGPLEAGLLEIVLGDLGATLAGPPALGGGGEEFLGGGVDAGEAVGDVALEGGAIGPARERGEAPARLLRAREGLGLRVLHHLQAMLERAVGRVVAREQLGGVVLDPARPGQRLERAERGGHAQDRLAPAADELARLGEELDLADAARPQLDVAARQRAGREAALLLADLSQHVVRVLDRREVEIAAPDERGEPLEIGVARGDIAGHRAGLDVGGALPGAPDRFVVALGRLHGHADRRGRGRGAEPEVGAEHVALARVLGDQLHQLAGDADVARLGLGEVGGVETVLVEEADQVDVGGVVQLARALLAHGDHGVAGARVQVVLAETRQAALAQLGAEEKPDGRGERRVGEAGQGVHHLAEAPDAPEIGQPDEERGARLRLAQLAGEGAGLGDLRVPHGVEERVERRLGRRAGGLGQPVGLALDQVAQIGAGPGGAAQEIAEGVGPERLGQVVEDGPRPRPLEGERRGGDARGKGILRHGLSFPGCTRASSPGGRKGAARGAHSLSVMAAATPGAVSGAVPGASSRAIRRTTGIASAAVMPGARRSS